MYVSRPLSYYKRFPETLSLQPESPNSGFLVFQDEESETYSCFGLCKNDSLEYLPFPQNKDLIIHGDDSSDDLDIIYGCLGDDSSDDGDDDVSIHSDEKKKKKNVVFIPVLNQPLSSNRYYAINTHGKHKGEAFTCSREEDMQTSCFCSYVEDVKPRPLDPHDMYQQYEIAIHKKKSSNGGRFTAKSVKSDAFPPKLLRSKGWKISTKPSKIYEIGEASGVNTSLREVLPDFNFPLSSKTSEVIEVGKWYCPFTFIKEGTLRDQMKRSRFYEMKLEQKWEKIFGCQNNYNETNSVIVDVVVETEIVYVAGNKVVWDDNNVVDGVAWFRNVGLRVEIVEKMKWEQERVGWRGGENNQVRVQRVEEYGDNFGGWKEFGCYVLVESFVLKSLDGTLVMSYDFRHIHQIKSKWE